MFANTEVEEAETGGQPSLLSEFQASKRHCLKTKMDRKNNLRMSSGLYTHIKQKAYFNKWIEFLLSVFQKFFKYLFLSYVYISVFWFVHMTLDAQRPEAGVGSPRAAVTGGCELPAVAARPSLPRCLPKTVTSSPPKWLGFSFISWRKKQHPRRTQSLKVTLLVDEVFSCSHQPQGQQRVAATLCLACWVSMGVLSEYWLSYTDGFYSVYVGSFARRSITEPSSLW